MLRLFVMKSILLLLSLTYVHAFPVDATAQLADPGYAQWGRLAMEETAKKYSDASIVDYKYEGRFKVSERKAEEKFRLWLHNDEREFGLRVTISIDTPSETLTGVKMEELSAQ